MGFHDKIDNSMTVDTLKQPVNRTDHEIFFTDIPKFNQWYSDRLSQSIKQLLVGQMLSSNNQMIRVAAGELMN